MIRRLRSGAWIAALAASALLVVACGSISQEDSKTVSNRLWSEEFGPRVDEVVLDHDADEALDHDGDTTADPDELAMIDEGPVYPLTGMPIEPSDQGAAGRSALVVKIDNHPRARPQTGLDMADIVFDLRAEGVTRFAAVFQSLVPDPVGPVRSSRTSDFDLVRGLDNPIYASSGGNDYVARGLRSLPIVEFTNRTRNEYFRDFSRPAPHNLYVNASELYALAPAGLPEPQPWFTYRRSGQSVTSAAATVTGPVTIAFTGSPVVTHTWDGSVGGWVRTQDRDPHTTAGGDQLAPENVVIMVTDYRTSPADAISPEVRSTGSGPLVVLTDGKAVAGRWERPEADDKLQLLDGDGEVIALTPGRTWVLMPEQGQVSFPPGQTPPGWNG